MYRLSRFRDLFPPAFTAFAAGADDDFTNAVASVG